MTLPINVFPMPAEGNNLFNVVIDTPQGSRNKYKYDEKRGLWRLSKILPIGTAFPFDFGFIPSTRGEDGDPLDVLVLTEEATFPGCVISARLIGLLEAEQTEEGKTLRNDRLIAVVETPYNPPEFHALSELSDQRLAEIEHFFVSYNAMEGRQFTPVGRHGPQQAEELVRLGARGVLANGGARRRTKSRA